MHPKLRTLWLSWSAITAAILFAMALVAVLLAGNAGRKLAAPELEQTTQVMGHSLARKIELALHYQVPIDALVGVDDWFAGMVDANAILEALALTDTSGKQLAAYGVSPQLRVILATRRSEQSSLVNGMYISTLALRNRNDVIVGWLHVGCVTPETGLAAWIGTFAAAALLAALASALLYKLIVLRLAQPLAECRAANTSLAAGALPRLYPIAVRDPATRLRAALAERIQNVRRSNAHLLLKIGEVRAAHFDPAILQALDDLAVPLAGREHKGDTLVDTGKPRPRSRATLRALGATAIGLLLIVSSLLFLQHLHGDADDQRVASAGRQSLHQGWLATLDNDQTILDEKLGDLLAQAHFTALLAANDDKALDAELERLSTPHLALAVFNLDGSPRAASGPRNESARLDPLTLEPLSEHALSIHGIWQNAARIYQSGVARRVTVGQQEMIVMAAQPLDYSLAHLSARLEAPTAVADIRGQPVSAQGAALIDAWKRGERKDRLINEDTALLITAPLITPSGHTIGTLLAALPTQNQLGLGVNLLMVLSVATVLTTALFLLFYLHQLFQPFARTTQRLEELADGKTESDVQFDEDSRELWQQRHAVQRIAEKIETLETLRRSRERQGRRQARFIRLQMMQLAERLDEGARRGILDDLERIEHAGQPVATRALDDPRLERMVDEFGILALGFQNLVSRVGQQYQELDRLVSELREALRAKTQFIALQQELEIARKMQLSILPHEFKPFNGLEMHGAMVPAKEVGGDFYDFFNIDEHRVAMVVADVSGKGIPAAFFMAIARTLLRAIAQFSDSPASCVARLNDLLAADNEEMMFVTLFYAIFDTRDGSLIYANAGHNLPYLLRADGRIEVVPGTHGVALAVVPDFDFQEGRLTLEPGDGLFLYTDGVTEAMDSREQLYGDARLILTLRTLRLLPVRDIPGRMVELIKEYETGVAQADDITCLMARYRGPA